MRSRRFLCGLVAVLAMVAANAARAADLGTPKPVGMLTAKGPVWVDRMPVPSTTAIFAGDSIATMQKGSAILKLSSGATAALMGEGEVELPNIAENTSLTLHKGILSVRSAGSNSTRVRVFGTSVEISGKDGYPALCTIAALGGQVSVMADKGRVTVRGKGAPISLAPGKSFRWAVGGQPAAPQAQQKAGTVSGAIPAETVERTGQPTPLVLKVNDSVNWQDLVKTQNTGRVRIALNDGSTLNVGARSEMRIVQHNVQSQQTEIELTLGKMRTQVIKLTKPGAKFEVRTQTAVIGVVGTIFLVNATPTSTNVTCIEGVVTVQNINPAIGGNVNLSSNQTTTVTSTAAPTAPVTAPLSQIQAQMTDTDVPTAPQAASGAGSGQGQGGTGGSGAGGASGGASAGGAASGISATGLAGIGAAGAALGTGIAAENAAGDASSALGSTNSSLQDAIDSANAATTAIQNSQQPSTSPSTPCGCGP